MKIKILVLIVISLIVFLVTPYGKYYLSIIGVDFQTEKIGYVGSEGKGFGQLQNFYLTKGDFENRKEENSILIADATPLLKEYDFSNCKGKEVTIIGKHSFRTPRKEGIIYDLVSINIVNGENVLNCLRYKE